MPWKDEYVKTKPVFITLPPSTTKVLIGIFFIQLGTATWWATLNAQITTRTDIFETESHGSGKWALRYSNLTCTGGGETRTSSVLLKPEKRQRSRSKSDLEDRVQNSEEESLNDSEEEDMVDDEFSRKERIIDKRMFQGRLQYLLRTEDGDEMWEDASTSKTELIREYEVSQGCVLLPAST